MRDIYPECDLNRWSVTNSCCEILANADDYYTKEQTEELLESVSGVTREQVEGIVEKAVSGKADVSVVNELASQVRQNTTDILNTYTKEQTNALLQTYYTKMQTNSMFANYTDIDNSILILNSNNI